MTSLLRGFGREGAAASQIVDREVDRPIRKAQTAPVEEMGSPRYGIDPEDFLGKNTREVLDRARQEHLVPITTAMVDEAVETVLSKRKFSRDVADVLMLTLSRDVTRGAAHAYFASQATERLGASGVARRNFVIKYSLSEDEMKTLDRYAPEYKFEYIHSENHDHGMAAACRLVDHRLIASRLPRNVTVSDIGGNPMVHIMAGGKKVHVCGPVKDVKDPVRHKLRMMRATKLINSPDEWISQSATRYVSGDESFVCGRIAQDCRVPSVVLTSIHVYDVPISDWPRIMQNKSASIVEGCVLFSNEFFTNKSGVLDAVGARYEIDEDTDTFSMGFVGSPSWWYKHKWSEFMLYGTDQILEAGGVAYTYKIIERRGDTIFFRILRLDPEGLKTQRHATRRTPGIPAVKVQGFELSHDAGKGTVVKKDYKFPRNLWYEMVAQASEDFERGVMDYNKMYNHYRTISVRQSINSVVVMGGEKVEADELVPLVVHACLAAAAQSLLGQRTTRAITSAQVANRPSYQDSVSKRISRILGKMAFHLTKRTGETIMALFSSADSQSAEQLEDLIMRWEPLVDDVIVDTHVIRGKSGLNVAASKSTNVYKDMASSTAAVDHLTTVLADPELSSALFTLCPHISKNPAVNDAQIIRRGSGSNVSDSVPPSYITGAGGAATGASRKAAIREHIEEIKMENRATSNVCRRAWVDLTVRGEPNVGALKLKSELYKNPDLWKVVNGVILSSALGLKASDFRHSAVFTARPDPDTGEVIRAVITDRWKSNVNYILSDSNYSGWVLTNDNLVIHNGPEIIGSMEVALDLDHDYDITLHKAPPGSGKTHAITHAVKPDGTDVVACPVRESILDTRRSIVELHPNFPDPVLRIRTVDSYLVNFYARPEVKLLKAERLLADEAFMTHSGKWLAMAALLGVKTIEAYGDDKQIPHIARAQVQNFYSRLKSNKVNEVWTTRRCPDSAVAAWGGVYEDRARTLSEVRGAPLKHVWNTNDMQIPDGCVMMCMYQADKVELRKKYAHALGKIKIITAHESEGKTYKHVWLHRFDTRPRQDSMSLFDQEPHVLVAMSRHTHSFYYVLAANLQDKVMEWIRLGNSPRRIAAVRDVTTAGEPLKL